MEEEDWWNRKTHWRKKSKKKNKWITRYRHKGDKERRGFEKDEALWSRSRRMRTKRRKSIGVDLEGQPGHVPSIIEEGPCIYHFLPPFAPQYFVLPTQYF